MYLYINLRTDSNYSSQESVDKIKQILNSRPELKPGKNSNFTNAADFLRISIGIINCDSNGNYPAQLSQKTSTANLIEFICTDDGDLEKENDIYTDTAKLYPRTFL